MAIPFRLPTQEETDDNYQLLDQLFDQLFQIARQIILFRGRLVNGVAVPPAHINPAFPLMRGATAEAAPSVSMQVNHEDGAEVPRPLPLPDIVLSTGFVPQSGPSRANAPVPAPRRFAPSTERPEPPPRRPRRRRPAGKRKSENTPEETSANRSNWQQVGKELRKIADEFRASNPSLQEDALAGDRSNTDIEAMKKEQSLLSLLVPAPFRGSLWTAVIFLVGWRILAGRGW